MRKLPKFTEHNCYCEQMIAYNHLFSYAHINGWPLDYILKCVQNANDRGELKKYDIQAIKNCITKNYDKYIKKPFIAGSYSEIAEQLPL